MKTGRRKLLVVVLHIIGTNDSVYFKSGDYLSLLKNQNGCDSIHFIHLNILKSSSDT